MQVIDFEVNGDCFGCNGGFGGYEFFKMEWRGFVDFVFEKFYNIFLDK